MGNYWATDFMISLLMLLKSLNGVKSAVLELSLIVLIDDKSNKSSCVGRPADEEDPRNQGS